MISLCFRQIPNGLKKSINFVPRRKIGDFNIFEGTIKRSEAYFKRKDNIDDTYVMIYRAPMTAAMPFFNLLTVIGAGIIGWFVYDRVKNQFKDYSSKRWQNPAFQSGTIIMSDDEIIYAMAGLVLVCVTLKIFIWRYPLRIYKNGTDYISIFESHIPYRRMRHNFIKGEVKELPPKGMLPWNDIKYKIKDRTAIMMTENFRSPSDRVHMMEPIKPPRPVKSIGK